MRRLSLLRLSPRALRFFVFALACLQFVAPTWHICEMGGHASRSLENKGGGHHGGAPNAAFDTATLDTSGPANQPLICVCVAPTHPIDPKTPRLDGVSGAHHETCLAMLLQAMPGQLSANVALFHTRALVQTSLEIAPDSAPRVAFPNRFRGRAPPQIC